jgi:hypothetical protein
MHGDEENAIDVKETLGPVVISQNTMYGYAPSSGSPGDAIRVNDEGDQGAIWILFNEIRDATWCINPLNARGTTRIIGNVLHDCEVAITDGATEVLNNTIFDVERGIDGGASHSNIVIASDVAISDEVDECSHVITWQGDRQASCSDSLEADPALVLDGARLTGVGEASPAIDAGQDDPAAYAAFEEDVGLDIRVDYAGRPRPAGGGWDVGAFER